jgi:hypothetical protein
MCANFPRRAVIFVETSVQTYIQRKICSSSLPPDFPLEPIIFNLVGERVWSPGANQIKTKIL